MAHTCIRTTHAHDHGSSAWRARSWASPASPIQHIAGFASFTTCLPSTACAGHPMTWHGGTSYSASVHTLHFHSTHASSFRTIHTKRQPQTRVGMCTPARITDTLRVVAGQPCVGWTHQVVILASQLGTVHRTSYMLKLHWDRVTHIALAAPTRPMGGELPACKGGQFLFVTCAFCVVRCSSSPA
jgi:hypothetical protein